jgi:CBS domain-containing protein
MTTNYQQKPVSDIMTRNICQVGSEQTVIDALAQMRGKSVSSVLVVDNADICGIITERDFVHAVHTSVDLKTMKCGGLMQSPVISVPQDTSCLDAYHQMASRGIRHLAVSDSAGKVVGLLSEGDLMRDFGIEYYMHFKNVGGVMNTDMCLLPASSLVADAVELMVERNQSCVLVIDANRNPIGILTERDVVWLCGDHPNSERLQLGTVMRAPVVTVTDNDLLHEAVKSMAVARIRRLAVVNESGAVIGLLTHHEIVREMERDYAAHLKALSDLQLRSKIQFKPLIDAKLVLETLARVAPDTTMLAADLNYHISYAAANAGRLLGLDTIQCIGMDLRDALLQAGWGQAHDDVREAVLADGQTAFQATIKDAAFSLRVFLMRDVQDNPCGFLACIQRSAATP